MMKSTRAMVLVSGDAVSMERGADQVFRTFQSEIQRLGLQDEVAVSWLHDPSRYDAAPLAVVYPEAVIYGSLTPGDARIIAEEHLYKGRQVDRLLASKHELSGRIAWLSARKGTLPAEKRIVLERVGAIDPEVIEDYIVHDGYEALAKVLSSMSPQEVITEIEASGLKGRGGAGFPTGTKWKFVSKAGAGQKYVICNADESEPGTFKDRLILEGDPQAILEAMAIAGYAIGADEGYIYIRGEYSLAQERLRKALQQAEAFGLIGDNIFQSGFNFHIHIHSGAGAYICGEETALLESIEGKRGEPRSRPPYPTTQGLWGKPTLINNVETLANIPAILRHGSAWYRGIGTAGSPGTKVYTILGHVNVTGLIEVPMGITLREVISIYGQGIKGNSHFKMAQTGGSSGSIIPASLQDTPMDFDSYSRAGVSLGSGALLICSEDTCAVDLCRVLVNFFRRESCGKCNPCRIGNDRAFQILTRITEGLGTHQDLEDLGKIESFLYQMSNCGLGQTAATPIKDTLAHFRAEINAHIDLKVCPSGVCPMSGHVTATL